MTTRHPIALIALLTLLATVLMVGCIEINTAQHEPSAAEAEQGLREANERLYAGLNEMFEGNIDTLVGLWSHSGTVTQMGPFGDRITGWDAVHEEFRQNAELNLGGSIVCEDLHVVAGRDMGYTVCVEVGENTDSEGNLIRVSHRATNVFARENGEWKLLHHHTDISNQLIEAYSGP